VDKVAPADLARLDALNAELALAVARADAPRSPLLERAFHALLARLERIELAHFGNRPVAQQSVRAHAAIIGALQQGGGAGAAAIMKKNRLP
jgi:DNA-binding GntR family transcriptional regulator